MKAAGEGAVIDIERRGEPIAEIAAAHQKTLLKPTQTDRQNVRLDGGHLEEDAARRYRQRAVEEDR